MQRAISSRTVRRRDWRLERRDAIGSSDATRNVLFFYYNHRFDDDDDARAPTSRRVRVTRRPSVGRFARRRWKDGND